MPDFTLQRLLVRPSRRGLYVYGFAAGCQHGYSFYGWRDQPWTWKVIWWWISEVESSNIPNVEALVRKKVKERLYREVPLDQLEDQVPGFQADFDRRTLMIRMRGDEPSYCRE